MAARQVGHETQNLSGETKRSDRIGPNHFHRVTLSELGIAKQIICLRLQYRFTRRGLDWTFRAAACYD